MTPITINGCFAWLHLPKSSQRNTALVLCPGLNVDEITAYSSLRLVADALAETGYPVLRLHYIGTGNSADIDCNVNHLTAWQDNIERSIDWMQQNCSAEHIVLCGLRFGGMLATIVAARRRDVSGLILLAPVLRGRSYMRQFHSDGFVNVGAKLSARSVESINQMDLQKVVPPSGCKTIVFTQSSGGARVIECMYKWRAAEVEVTVKDFAGLEPMLRPTFTNHKVSVKTEPVVAWMEKTYPARSSACSVLSLPKVRIKSHRWTETPLSFGADGSLFGILCRPHHATTGSVVIIGNASADPHCAGNTVELARQLAAKGVPSLRMDYAGVGDSPSATGVGSHVFETDRTKDISAAIDALQPLGYTKFATEGLCSGAYHAYRAAVAESRVDYAFMINLPCFNWVPGFPVEELVLHDRTPGALLHEMRAKAFWFNQWNKIAHGEWHLIRSRLRWLGRKLREGVGPGRSRKPGPHPSRQVKMLFMVSEGDVSRDILRREFGAPGVFPGVTMELVEGLDHSMHHRDICAAIADRISSFLASDHPLSAYRTHGAGVQSARVVASRPRSANYPGPTRILADGADTP